MSLGIIFALVAMLFWGFGDFLIQRSTRKFGSWETLFVISGFGAIVLLPFVWWKIPALFVAGNSAIPILILAGIALFIASILEFEALRRGKISVIEPTWSLEIPVSIVLALFILGEKLSLIQILVISSLVVGLFLVSYQGKVFSKKFFLERGVIISIISAIVMGAANVFVGWGARETDFLMIIFIVSLFAFAGSGLILGIRGKFGETFHNLRTYPKLLFTMSFLDNAAWVAFAFAMTLAPISIAVAFSESYILIAVILGLLVNKEKLQRHQSVGLVLAVLSAIILATQTV